MPLRELIRTRCLGSNNDDSKTIDLHSVDPRFPHRGWFVPPLPNLMKEYSLQWNPEVSEEWLYDEARAVSTGIPDTSIFKTEL